MKFDLTKAAQVAVIWLALVLTIAVVAFAISALATPASPQFAQEYPPPSPHEKKRHMLPHEKKGHALPDERKKGYAFPDERKGPIPLREQQGDQPPPPPPPPQPQ